MLLLFIHVSDSVTARTVAFQAPLSMGFPRQDGWSGLPFPFLGDLPGPKIEPNLLDWQAASLPLSHLELWCMELTVKQEI